VEEALHASGQPLDTETRTYMEPRFGHDFSQVRVHTDERAAASAEAVDALAYTVGRDIVFGQGQYAPTMSEGQRLIAHELTHVAQQQRSSDVERPSGGVSVSHPGDAAEREADSIAGQVAQGGEVAVTTAATATVQRDAVDAPETGPDTLPAVATEGQESTAENMKDERIAEGIIDDQLAILTGWDTALENFFTVLTSASDKEAKPNFSKVITEFLVDEVMGELTKHAGKAASEAFGLLKKLTAEVERVEAAEKSVALRDFVVQHRTELGKLKQSAFALRAPFADRVTKVREAKEKAESGGESPHPRRSRGKPKGHVEVASDATKASDDYWTMHLDLINAYQAINDKLKVATPEILFRRLSEEWIREATHRVGMGIKAEAQVIIRLWPNYTVMDAYIQGAGGQKIAEELLRESPGGVDVFGLETKRVIKLMASNGWPDAILYLDENDRNMNTGAFVEGDWPTLQRYVLANGLPPTKNLRGE
jgi:hypothetical protein